MQKNISIAKSMPSIFAIASGVIVASYLYTEMFAVMSIGRTSSTFALNFVVAPIVILIVAFIGFIVGFIPRFFLEKRGEKDFVNKSPYLIKIAIITIILATLSAAAAFMRVISYEEFNSPHLLDNKANFNKIMYPEYDMLSETKSAELSWAYDDTNIEPLMWNQMSLTTQVRNSTQLLISNGNKAEISYNFKGYTHITEVSLLPINNSENISFLTVLVRLAATSYRSMLLIYDQDFNLVYEELLERCGSEQYLGRTRAIDGDVIEVNICAHFIININK